MLYYTRACAHAGQNYVDEQLQQIISNPDLKKKNEDGKNISVLTLDYFSPWLNDNGITLADIRSAGRDSRLIHFRHTLIYFYMLRYNKNRDLKDPEYVTIINIGALFGNRDHSTILHAYNTYAINVVENKVRKMIYKSFIYFLTINNCYNSNFEALCLKLNS